MQENIKVQMKTRLIDLLMKYIFFLIEIKSVFY